jgi:hypothetical protein
MIGLAHLAPIGVRREVPDDDIIGIFGENFADEVAVVLCFNQKKPPARSQLK